MGEWQPIDTAPRDGTHVLLWAPDYIERAALGYWSETAGVWFTDVASMGDGPAEDHLDECGGPTHWMELPTPPQGETP